MLPDKVGPSHLAPDEIVGVVCDAHLVGFGVSHPGFSHRGGHGRELGLPHRFVKRRDFDGLRPYARFMCPLQDALDSSPERDVIVLDQHAV